MPENKTPKELWEMATGQPAPDNLNVDALYSGRNQPVLRPKSGSKTQLDEEDERALLDIITRMSVAGSIGGILDNIPLGGVGSTPEGHTARSNVGLPNEDNERDYAQRLVEWLSEMNQATGGRPVEPSRANVGSAYLLSSPLYLMDAINTGGEWFNAPLTAAGGGVASGLGSTYNWLTADVGSSKKNNAQENFENVSPSEEQRQLQTPDVEGDGPPEGAPTEASVVGGSNDDMPVWDWGTPAQDMDANNITTDDDIIELAQAIEAYGHAPAVYSTEMGFGINNSGHLEELIRTRRSPREGPDAPVAFDQFREMARQQLIQQWNEISQGAPIPSQAERLARTQIQRQLEAQQRQAAQAQLSSIETPEGIRRLSSDEQEMYAQGIMQQAQQTSQPEDVQMLQEAWETLGTEEFLIRFFVPAEEEETEEEGDE